jgi:VanZ family protein
LIEKRRVFWVYSAPAVFYGIIIIIATGMPGNLIPSVGFTGIDKVVHFGMHFIFAMLVHRALLFHADGALIRGHTLLLTVIFVSVFGIIIEWYQVFIPGRTPTVWDGLANILGAVIYAALYPLVLSGIWPEKRIRVLRNLE